MKSYGLPRHTDAEFPDAQDMRIYGRKSSAGKLAGKGENIRSSQKSKNKRATRRIWKKKARKEGKDLIEGDFERS